MKKMKQRKKNQGTQKNIKIADASNVVRTPYDKPLRSFPLKEKTCKNICKCKNQTTTFTPQTWQSITKMYGDADTTEVWDNQTNKPKTLFQSKKHNKVKQEDKGNNRKSKINKKHKTHRRSIINIHHKRDKPKKDIPDKNQKIGDIKPENEEVKNHGYKEKLSLLFQHNGRGDAKIEEQNTIDPANKTNKTLLKPNKKTPVPVTDLKTIEDRGGMKHKTKNSRDFTISIENIKKLLNKCSFIDMFLKRSKKISGKDSNSEPAFVMKVDSTNLRVMNASEIKEKIKKLGKIRRRRSCICPSRKKRLRNGLDVCPKGLCESALKNKIIGFDCKCREKSNVIVCQDSDCDLTKLKRKKRCCLKKKPEQDKPLLQVVLDSDNMSILNSNEIGNLLTNRATTGICPTGICKTASKDRKIDLKCRCLAKKLQVPTITECTNKTCNRPERKFTLSNLCSRVFRQSECFNILGNSFPNKKPEKNIKPKSVAIKKYKVTETLPEKEITKREKKTIITPIKKPIKTKTETNKLEKKKTKPEKKKTKPENKKTTPEKKETAPKKSKSKKKKQKKKKGKLTKKAMKCVKTVNCKRRKKQRNCKQKIIHCLQKKQERCENELEKKKKEFKRNEKKTKKKIVETTKREAKLRKTEAAHWNCLAKFVSGFLNIGIQLTKKFLLLPYNLLVNPIGSYVYCRERAKDPPRTIKRIFDWFERTWLIRSTGLSKLVKHSHVMNVISDQLEDTALFDAVFASKGKTKEEQLLYENKKALRKKRIMRRQDEALYSCRHSLLLTLRKTPCLWFYHILPDLYPQCLSFVSFLRNFFHLILFLSAVLCWTPCIIAFEICRAFLCCFLCTN